MIGTTRPEDLGRIAALKRFIEDNSLSESIQLLQDVPRSQLVDIMSSSIAGVHSMLDEHFGIGVVELADSGLMTIAHNSAGPKMDIIVPPVDLSLNSSDGYGNSTHNSTSNDDVERICQEIMQRGSPVQCDIDLLRRNVSKVVNCKAVGYLCTTVEEYCVAMNDVLAKYEDSLQVENDDIITDFDVIRYNAYRRMRTMFSIQCFQDNVRKHIIPHLIQDGLNHKKQS